LSRTWLKYYFWLFIYLFIYLSYLFKEIVFIFELCVMGLRPHGAVMRVVSVACEFSVVVCAGAAGWRGLVGLLEHYAVM
jgi:hypothetical protein